MDLDLSLRLCLAFMVSQKDKLGFCISDIMLPSMPLPLRLYLPLALWLCLPLILPLCLYQEEAWFKQHIVLFTDEKTVNKELQLVPVDIKNALLVLEMFPCDI